MKPDTRFKLGEWLPDLADLDNPGVLEALNVLWESGQYRAYLPLSATSAALGQMPLGAYRATGFAGTEVSVVACDGTTAHIYAGTGATASSWTDVTPTPSPSPSIRNGMFAQYKEEVFVTSRGPTSGPYSRTILAGGGSTPYAKLTGAYGDAPKAGVIGVVGQFLVLGDLFWNAGGFPYQIQWSGIDAPHNWPTPNSADAIAQQSGTQYFKAQYGKVLGIADGDQWSVVLMDGAIERMTYTGGNTVFGFDTIYQGPGPVSPDAWVKFGPYVYYASATGFYVTDGTNVIPIGRNKVDRYFTSTCDFNNANLVRVGVHWDKRLVYWTFPTHSSSGIVAEMMVFNIDEKKWTHVQDTIACFVKGEEANIVFDGIEAFSTNKSCGYFVGFPGTVTFVTAEAEFNPGKRAIVTSVTPQVSGATSVSVKVGSRSTQSGSVVYTPSITPDAFTGDCNCFVDNRYHRAEIDIVGFATATGGTFEAQPSSSF